MILYVYPADGSGSHLWLGVAIRVLIKTKKGLATLHVVNVCCLAQECGPCIVINHKIILCDLVFTNNIQCNNIILSSAPTPSLLGHS